MALDMTGFESLHRTPERKREEFNRLIELVEPLSGDSMERAKDKEFLEHMRDEATTPVFMPSEAQLCWLRDIAEKYL